MAAIELGCRYEFFVNDLSASFVLNDPTDPNFVGYVTDISGLDDAGVRENAQTVVAGDGGYHGRFWKDRRPWTFSGIIMPTMPVISRSAAQEKMQGVLGNCLASDGFLSWIPADGLRRWLPFRKQQSTRMATGQSKVEKTFQIAGVSADWRIFSYVLHQVSATASSSPLLLPSVVNAGNADAPLWAQINGPINGFAVVNFTASKQIKINLNLADTHYAVVDLSGTYPTVIQDNSSNQYGTVDPLGTDWSIAAIPGSNSFGLVEATPGSMGLDTTLTLRWRDSWQ